MSVEQIESAIQALTPEERQELARWFDDHRHELVGADAGDNLTEAQKEELLRRRREYDEHPERFTRLDARGVDEMCERINREVERRVSSAR